MSQRYNPPHCYCITDHIERESNKTCYLDQECENDQFQDYDNGNDCKACQYPCATCVDSATNCLTCHADAKMDDR